MRSLQPLKKDSERGQRDTVSGDLLTDHDNPHAFDDVTSRARPPSSITKSTV
ncbi:hypothetical protein [Nocardia wallacei]|uniref:hypothetical protein n=1 Tax=Nocardia wallacei TaxID=480035 RepID=UPI002457D92A|nr:hypothetical protein [Nocardia wallacei]